jgi:hypothetical protein
VSEVQVELLRLMALALEANSPSMARLCRDAAAEIEELRKRVMELEAAAEHCSKQGGSEH